METRVAYDRLFVGGAWVPARGEPIELISPVTEEVYAVVPSASEEDVDLAVASARDAFDAGPWPRLPLEERLSILRKLRDLLAANEERIARLITDEMGCPISQSRVSQAANPVKILDAYLDLAPELPVPRHPPGRDRQRTRHSRAGRRGRRRRAVERAVGHQHPEAGAGGARRVHGGAQTRPADSARRLSAG